MAADFLTVNTSKPLGAKLVAAANLLRQLRELVQQMADCSGHMFTGADYSVLEQQFGLQTGTGANVATLIGIQQGILVGATGAGGATQQGQILEFCSRLAGQ
jgi:hypothetical protein